MVLCICPPIHREESLATGFYRLVIQSPLPVVPTSLVELGFMARLAFLGVNSTDWIHVSPTLTNLDVLVHCSYSLEKIRIDVK